MELTEVDKRFAKEILVWLKDGREWRIAGGAADKSLGERLIEIEKIFDNSKILKITRGRRLIGFFRLINAGAGRLVFHTYICREYRQKGYGYFAVKKLIEESFNQGYQEISTCAKGQAKEYLQRWPIWEDTHTKIRGYNIYRIRKDTYASRSTDSRSSHSRSRSLLSGQTKQGSEKSARSSRS